MLPDAASGQGPDTLARSPERSEGSRCKEGMAWFLPSGYGFSDLYECRGTMLIGSRNKSRYMKFYYGQWRGRGISYYKSVKGAGAKAKTMTNNFPILSVLAKVLLFKGLAGFV